MKKFKNNEIKLKIDNLENNFSIIKDLSNLLVEYSFINLESDNNIILSLVSTLNEKIEKFDKDYYDFGEFIYNKY